MHRISKKVIFFGFALVIIIPLIFILIQTFLYSKPIISEYYQMGQYKYTYNLNRSSFIHTNDGGDLFINYENKEPTLMKIDDKKVSFEFKFKGIEETYEKYEYSLFECKDYYYAIAFDLNDIDFYNLLIFSKAGALINYFDLYSKVSKIDFSSIDMCDNRFYVSYKKNDKLIFGYYDIDGEYTLKDINYPDVSGITNISVNNQKIIFFESNKISLLKNDSILLLHDGFVMNYYLRNDQLSIMYKDENNNLNIKTFDLDASIVYNENFNIRLGEYADLIVSDAQYFYIYLNYEKGYIYKINKDIKNDITLYQLSFNSTLIANFKSLCIIKTNELRISFIDTQKTIKNEELYIISLYDIKVA